MAYKHVYHTPIQVHHLYICTSTKVPLKVETVVPSLEESPSSIAVSWLRPLEEAL